MTKPWETPQPASAQLKRLFSVQSDKEMINYTTIPYVDYLQTDHWKVKREEALFAAKYECLICCSKTRLEVHHRTYERRGCELLSDLAVLCHDCHTHHHRNRTLGDD